jgi:FkbM family methyltransferase
VRSPAGDAPLLTLERDGVTLRFDVAGFTATPYVYRPITQGRLYEDTFLEHIRALHRVGQYVDVGAHLGTHTVFFAELCPATHVHAFEPVGRYADVIRRNVAANTLGDRVTVHQIGLAERPGRASNYLSPEHQMGFVAGEAAGVTEEFAVKRLDDVVRSPVAVIKLDVEGMESAVLAGATRILSRHRPVVFAEAHTPAQARALAQQLVRFGYRTTGRIFNSTPTYEFVARPRQGWERLRPAYARLPAAVRSRLRRLTR